MLFGTIDDDGTERIVEKLVPLYQTWYVQKSDQRGVDASPGTFSLHVGFAPQFEDVADVDLDKSLSRNVRFVGQGQKGTIMGQYIFNKMIEGTGFA